MMKKRLSRPVLFVVWAFVAAFAPVLSAQPASTTEEVPQGAQADDVAPDAMGEDDADGSPDAAFEDASADNSASAADAPPAVDPDGPHSEVAPPPRPLDEDASVSPSRDPAAGENDEDTIIVGEPSQGANIDRGADEDGDEETDMNPDQSLLADSWSPLWALVGCAVCGGIPGLLAVSSAGFGSMLTLSSIGGDSCGDVLGVIVGITFAILGLMFAGVGAVTAPVGTAIGTGISRWNEDRPILWPTLAALVGVVPIVAALAGIAGSVAAIVAFSENEPDSPVIYLGFLGAVVAATTVTLLSGPLAVGAATGTMMLVDDDSDDSGDTIPDDVAGPDRSSARSSTTATSAGEHLTRRLLGERSTGKPTAMRF